MSIEDLLHSNQNADLLRFSTCGSVDDGKSTLIGRMLYEAKGLYDDQLSALKKASEKIQRDDHLEFGLLTDGLLRPSANRASPSMSPTATSRRRVAASSSRTRRGTSSTRATW